MAKKKLDYTTYLDLMHAIDAYCEDTENFKEFNYTSRRLELGIEVKLSIKKVQG